MKAKISSYGQLFIERAGALKPQNCIYSTGYSLDHSKPCGDACPAFAGPQVSPTGGAKIKLCTAAGWLYFDEVMDER